MIAPEHTARPGVEGRCPSPSFDDTNTHDAWVGPSNADTLRGDGVVPSSSVVGERRIAEA